MSRPHKQDEDDTLLKRLNALKKTSIVLDQRSSIPAESSSENDNDLVHRFAALQPKSLYSEDVVDRTSIDDAAIANLLSDLGPGEQWDAGLEAEEGERMRGLLKEAEEILDMDFNKAREGEKEGEQLRPRADPVASTSSARYKSKGTEKEQTDAASGDDVEEGFEEEANEYLEKILVDMELERADFHEGDSIENTEAHSSATLNFPTAPQTLPSAADTTYLDDGDTDKDLKARLKSLTLPSVPNSNPTNKKEQNKTKHSDKEVDSWCVICLADATVRCIGCEGDLYCITCWNEGHRGESAGMEERRHRAVQWQRDGAIKE